MEQDYEQAGFEQAVAGIGSLREPLRRELYRYVCSQDEPVGREEAAEATGIAHHSVKFHLDKLVADGLLEVDYRRLGERTGPGAGRPAKVYRPVRAEFSMSLPPREYVLAGEVLAEAVEEAGASGRPVLEVLTEVAGARGVQLATDADLDAAELADPDQALVVAARILARHGFAPRVDGQRLLLSNCPFHALAQRHRGLVCGMNHALMDGFVGELAPCLSATLDPAPGRCCVTLSGSCEAPNI